MKIIYYLSGKPSECVSTHHFECPCIFSFKFEHQRQRYFKIMEQWQIITTEIPELNGKIYLAHDISVHFHVSFI